jgi:hypothetical protein
LVKSASVLVTQLWVHLVALPWIQAGCTLHNWGCELAPRELCCMKVLLAMDGNSNTRP